MKKFTRVLMLALAIVTVLSMCVSAFDLTTFGDYNANHWANTALSDAVDNNLLGGYEDKTIRADRELSRAEMATIVNRAFGASVQAPVGQFKDLKNTDWFYSEIAKAVQMQTFGGTGTAIEATRAIYREEAMVVIARALVLKDGDLSVIQKYSDYGEVSPWALGSVAALVEKGYVNGTNMNLIEPRAHVTRAQFAQIMYNIFSDYIQVSDTYSINSERSLMINVPNVTLQNCTINGDLVLGDGVGRGFVKLSNVKVTGRILIRGGDKVTFKNVTAGEGIVVKNLNGTVNFQNYKTEAIFKNILTYTDVTYLTRNVYPVPGPSTTYYNVYFYADEEGTDGNTVIKTDLVAKGASATAPTAPEKASDDEWDYTFAGWDKDFTNVQSTLHVYPTYTKTARKYPITLDYVYPVYFNTAPKNSFTVTFNELINPKLPYTGFSLADAVARENKVFDGWYAGTTLIDENTKYSDIKGTTTLTASWIDVFKVIFYNGDGSVLETQTVRKGEDATRPTKTPSKPEDTDTISYGDFIDWEGDYTGVQGIVHVYPKFEENERTYTLHLDYGVGTEYTSTKIEFITVKFNDLLADHLPTSGFKNGNNVFGGWYYGTEEIDVEKYSDIKGATELEASWIPTYTVTFKDWDGTELKKETGVLEHTSATAPADPEREADEKYTYTFAGWDADGDGDSDSDDTNLYSSVTGDLTVKALYDESFILYKVTFKHNNGTDGYTEIKDIHYGDTVEAVKESDMTKPSEFKYLKGWRLDAQTLITTDSFEFTYTTDIVLTAEWAGAYFKVEHYIPDENGKYPTVPYKTTEHGAEVGDPVHAKNYSNKDITDLGYRLEEPLCTSGTVTDNDISTLVLKAYYAKTYTVTFYGFDQDRNIIELDRVENLVAGDTVSDFPDYADETRGHKWGPGYTHEAVNTVYKTENVHKISTSWGHKVDGEYEEFTEETKVYSDIDVYPVYKEMTLELFVKKLENNGGGRFQFYTVYDNSRLVDSAIDVLYNARSLIWPIKLTGAEDKLLAKLDEKGVINKDSREILNQEVRIKLVTLIGDENLDEFVKNEAEKNVSEDNMTSFLKGYIHDKPDEATALLLDFLHLATQDDIDNIFKPAVKVFLDKDPNLLEAEIKDYINGLTNDAIKGLIKDEPEFVKSFIKSNPDMVKTYIQGDSTELKNFIKDNPAQLKTFIESNSKGEVKTFVMNNKALLKTEMYSFITDLGNFNTFLVPRLSDNTVYRDFVVPAIMSELDGYVSANNLSALNEVLNRVCGITIPDVSFYNRAEIENTLNTATGNDKNTIIAEITSSLDGTDATEAENRKKIADIIYGDTNLFNSAVDEAINNSTFLTAAINKAVDNEAFFNTMFNTAIGNPDFFNSAINSALDNNSFLTALLSTTLADTAINNILASKDDNVEGDDFDLALNSIVETMTNAENKDDTIDKIIGILFDGDHGEQLDTAVSIVVHDIATSTNSDVLSLVEEFSQDVILYLEGHPDKKETLVEMVVDDLYSETIDLFVKQLREEEKFTVHDNFSSLIAMAMYNKYNGMSIDGFMNEVKLPDSFDKVLSNEAIRDIVENIYYKSLNPYLAQLKDAHDKFDADPAENKGTYYVDTFVTVKVNPVAELVNPLYDEFRRILDEKIDDKHYYKDNTYTLALVDFLSPDILLNKMADGSFDANVSSGYTIPTAEELYTIIYTVAVLADDAGRWYYDELGDKYEGAVDKFEDKILEYANCLIGLVNEYHENGTIPSIDDLPDDKIRELLEKYDIQGIVDRTEQIQAIKDKIIANEKFNSVIDKFYNSKFNRPITGEDYDKAKRVLDIFFYGYEDEEMGIDFVFDSILTNEKFDKVRIDEDEYEVTFKENIVNLTRDMYLDE